MQFLKNVFCSGNFTKNRLEAFSDGVFAIVITLLILEIRVPHIEEGIYLSRDLTSALFALYPKYISYIVSFLYIAIYWVNHHQLFHIISKSDRGLFWLNSLFLMFLAFIPFPTALIGEYPNERIAIMFYGAIMFLNALSFIVMKYYAVDVAHLTNPNVESDILKKSLFHLLAGPVLYILAFIFAFILPSISLIIYILIPIIYIFPAHLEKET